MLRRSLIVLALLATTAAAQPQQGAPRAGVERSSMDPAVKPGDDFYLYANGAWQKATQIPADRSSIGSFYEAFATTEQRTTGMVDQIVRGTPKPGSPEARIANYYKAYTDTRAIDAAGIKPIAA
ncbi:MAG: M13 family metallopeptidase, partial [Sphingomonadales bacterium]|nr:M13 family metallopeptidase [Sphingomonadales bacterium]